MLFEYSNWGVEGTSSSRAFVTQIYVAALLGIISAIPIIIREIAEFVGPALYQNERER
jgi:Sec-independent protein secretion pathway component TatC